MEKYTARRRRITNPSTNATTAAKRPAKRMDRRGDMPACSTPIADA